LLDLVEAGDAGGVLTAIEHHRQRPLVLEFDDHTFGHSAESRAWLTRLRQEARV
jgi:hypothetical protein